MAKVTGPLMSMSASGSIGKSIVFSIWKGVAYVRQWLKPANPQSADQGDVRIILGGTGRAVAQVKPTSGYETKLVAEGVVPAGQSKQSYLVKKIIDTYLADASDYATALAEFTGHASVSLFKGIADDLGVAEVDLDYATISPYDKGLGIYLLAKLGIALGFTGAPYATALSSWTATETAAFKADLAAA